MNKFCFSVVLLGLLVLGSSSRAVVIEIGSATGAAGATVSIGATVKTEGSAVRGVVSEVGVSETTPLVACTTNPIFDEVGTIVLKPEGCAAGVNCLSARAVLLQFSEALIPDQTVLYSCDFKITAGATGTYGVDCVDGSASDPSGSELSTTCIPGVISVSSTSECAGDCNGDGEVFGNEVTIAINIVAGTAELDTCMSADVDNDGEVFGNEVTIAINNVANGCPS